MEDESQLTFQDISDRSPLYETISDVCSDLMSSSECPVITEITESEFAVLIPPTVSVVDPDKISSAYLEKIRRFHTDSLSVVVTSICVESERAIIHLVVPSEGTPEDFERTAYDSFDFKKFVSSTLSEVVSH